MTKKIKVLIIVFSSVIALLAVLCFIFIPMIKDGINYKKALKQVQEYYDSKVEIFTNENVNYQEGEVEIIFLGDSLTDGYNLATYYPEYSTLNRGIGGDTTIGLEKRLDISVINLKPKVAVMLIGGNNLSTMFDNYESILIKFKEQMPNTKIVLLSLTALGKNFADRNQVACLNNVKIKKLADKYGYTFVDIFTPLYDIETGELYANYTEDGIHFTSEGYNVITEAIKPHLKFLLGK